MKAAEPRERAMSEDIQVSDATTKEPARKVFVSHGRDDAALQAVARFLEGLDLEVVKGEQPGQGRPTIEELDAYAADADFAVVLLTPDDVDTGVPASRQNSRDRRDVVFELGYLAGRLGGGRACLLRKGDVKVPLDLDGVVYVDLDPVGGWQHKLVESFDAAERASVDVVLAIPGDLASRLGAGRAGLARRAREALAAEEYRAGRLTRPGLRRLLGFETRAEVDGFLKAHGIDEAMTVAEFERERQGLDRLGI